jgi:hypothetical protein
MKVLQCVLVAGMALGIVAQNPQPMLLTEAGKLLTPNYAKMEKGWAKNSDGMYHIASKFATS